MVALLHEADLHVFLGQQAHVHGLYPPDLIAVFGTVRGEFARTRNIEDGHLRPALRVDIRLADGVAGIRDRRESPRRADRSRARAIQGGGSKRAIGRPIPEVAVLDMSGFTGVIGLAKGIN